VTLKFCHQILGLPADGRILALHVRSLHVVHLQDVDQLEAERPDVLADLGAPEVEF
jgi:hypothetical protein